MQCVHHPQEKMTPIQTQYGIRWTCSVLGCTVACWDGPTSSPADAETRRLRHECHRALDPLWRGRTPFKSRNAAYAWLGSVLGLKKDQAHIGLLDSEQCRRLLKAIRDLEAKAR